MQVQKEIKVTIDGLGNPKVEAIGFNGQGCAQATKGLEEALAGAGGIMDRSYKPEWNNTDTKQQEGIKQTW